MARDNTPQERIYLTEDTYLLKIKGKFTPYKVINGQRCPIRGRNKNGHLVWRTYASVEEAKVNLFGSL